MFARRDAQERGRSMPAHLRSVLAPSPVTASNQESTVDAGLALKPSERFARGNLDSPPQQGQGDSDMASASSRTVPRHSPTNFPAADGVHDHVQNLPPRPSLPDKQKRSFFGSFGARKEKSLPLIRDVPDAVVPAKATTPEPEPSRLSTMDPPAERPDGSPSLSTTNGSSNPLGRFEPSLPMRSAAPLPSLPLSGGSVPTPFNSALPTRSMASHDPPERNSAFATFNAPAGAASPGLPRSTSTTLESFNKSPSVPRSVSTGSYSPLATFLGQGTPNGVVVPAPLGAAYGIENGTRSPASLSDAGTGPRKSSLEDLSTPATSDGGHAESSSKKQSPVIMPQRAASSIPTSSTLEGLLSRYAPRPLSSVPAADASTDAGFVRPNSPQTASPGIAAPIASSYLYGSGTSMAPPAEPILRTEVQASSSSSPPPGMFVTGLTRSLAREQPPRQMDSLQPIRHQDSSQSTHSETTLGGRGLNGSTTPSVFTTYTSTAGSSPVVVSSTYATSPFAYSASQATANATTESEQSEGGNRLQSPFATGWMSTAPVLAPLVSSSTQPNQQAAASTYKWSPWSKWSYGSNTNDGQASTPALNAAQPQAVVSPPLFSPPPIPPELPIGGPMTRLSLASREARDRLTNLYAELDGGGRNSPALSQSSISRPPSTEPSVSAGALDVSGSSSVVMTKGGSDADVSGFDSTSLIGSLEAPKVPLCLGNPRMEHAFSKFPRTIFARLVNELDWVDLRALREVSKALRGVFEVEATREIIFERYLGKYGYRTLPPSDYGGGPSLDLTLRDLDAFLTVLRMINASMRAWNRLVVRCRIQGAPFCKATASTSPVYKDGRAAYLRVWVPLRDGHWMQDDEVVQCEKEIWRAGVWSLVHKGDVVWNVAQGDFANEGKLISDSKFLRDLMYVYDHVGHLPNWLNAMCFSPGFWHNVLSSSDLNHPVIYTSLTPWAQQIKESLVLCKENVAANQNASRYRIQRYVYRGRAELKADTLVGSASGLNGRGLGGMDCIHPAWVGQLFVETEGTTEHAQELIRRCLEPGLMPYRVLREKSRPNKLVIRPIFETEKIA